MCNITINSFALLCTFLLSSICFWSDTVASSSRSASSVALAKGEARPAASSSSSSSSSSAASVAGQRKVSSVAKSHDKGLRPPPQNLLPIVSVGTSAAAASAAVSSVALAKGDASVTAPLLHNRIARASSLKEKMAIIKAAHDNEAALSLLTLPKEDANELMNNRIASYVSNDSPMAQLHRQYFAQQRRLGHEEWAMRTERAFEHHDKRKKKLKLQDRAHAEKFKKDCESLLRQDPHNLLVMHSAMVDRGAIFELFASCLHIQHEEEKVEWQKKEAQSQQREQALLAEIKKLQSSNEKLQSEVLRQTSGGSRSKSVKKGTATK